MKVRVLFFAQLRDILGMPEQSLEVGEKLTAGELANRFFHPAGRPPLLYAVNECFVGADHELQDSDTLALMTQVSGG